ncbi:MAG: 3-methyl-2-oxobutanoate hydroxymethyltransferase [Brevinematia bacterium]
MMIHKIIAKKGKEKITMLTCYDFLTAKILEDAGIDIILVGDSLGTVIKGEKNTLNVTMEEMIYHLKIVRKGASNSIIVADMPFLSYGTSKEESVKNAGRLIKETGANAVKLEGGKELSEVVRAMTTIGIPVMGHIGLKPQSVNIYGYRVAGKTDEEVKKLLEDAKALEEAGAFSIVIEETTEEAAKAITESIKIPTIGIGAGRFTDGQVLVITDMLGMEKDKSYKHNKAYTNLYEIIRKAVSEYISEVKKGNFPSEENVFHGQV